MSISRTNLVNYLENFKVSELKQLNKYFNIRVTRQTGGGSLKKRELIWNLVGGGDGALVAQVLGGTKKKSGWDKLRRSPFKTKKHKEEEAARAAVEAAAQEQAAFPAQPAHPSIAEFAAHERAAAARVAELDADAAEIRRHRYARFGGVDAAKPEQYTYHHTAAISRAAGREVLLRERVEQNTTFNNNNVIAQTREQDEEEVTKIDYILLKPLSTELHHRLYNPRRWRRPRDDAKMRANITVTLKLKNPEQIGLGGGEGESLGGQFNVIAVRYSVKNEVEVILQWHRGQQSDYNGGGPNMVHETRRFLDIKDRIIGTPTITPWKIDEKLPLY